MPTAAPAGQQRIIAIASAALMAVSTQAQAVVRLTGATVLSLDLAMALNAGCAGGAAVYKNSTTANSLGNQFTVKCFGGNFVLNGTGTGENEMRFDVTGGTAGDRQTTTAILGDYDFAYEMALYIASGASASANATLGMLSQAVGLLPTSIQSAGLFKSCFAASPESRFGRGGSSRTPYRTGC